MNFYKYNNHTIASPMAPLNLQGAEPLMSEDLREFNGEIFYVDAKDPSCFRSSINIYAAGLLNYPKEDLTILKSKSPQDKIPEVLLKAINEHRLGFINSAYSNWEDLIKKEKKKKHKISLVGLGDVGGTLITGLRLLGVDVIESIGIYDKNEEKIERWLLEGNQIFEINNPMLPPIVPLKEEDIFTTDIFIFCVSVGVPEVGKEGKDVRLIQFEGNSKILSYYAKKAREHNFNGLFAVVSDPVDLLCKVAFNESNKNSEGSFDFKGLASHQIKGYGLGVMNARANYYASLREDTQNYINEGRAFGPHGEGLIIANSIENYNKELSEFLTHSTKTANLKVRAAGFKPYVAPALSSGALSLIATLKGQWHYSSNFIGGVFMGCKNRETPLGIEFETLDFPEELFSKLEETYGYLKSLYY